jgi:hypothetical protein
MNTENVALAALAEMLEALVYKDRSRAVVATRVLLGELLSDRPLPVMHVDVDEDDIPTDPGFIQ